MSSIEGFMSRGIKTYKYNKKLDCFNVLQKDNSDSDIIKDMVSIVNFLEESKRFYTVEPDFCIRLYAMQEENFVVELTGNGKIISFNNYAVCITGYEADEVLDKSWFDIFIPQNEKEKINNIHNSVLEGDSLSWYCTNDILCKDKTLKTINWTNFLLRSDDETRKKIFSIGHLKL